MSAVAALFVLLIIVFSGCQSSCNRPAPAPPTPSESASPSATPTATATPMPTPVPFTQRNFPALGGAVVGKEFDYTPDAPQEVHLVSAKLGEDSKLIAKANHVSRFATIDSNRSLHIDNGAHRADRYHQRNPRQSAAADALLL